MARILVVDDEKNIRALFRDELEEEGYEVDMAGSGGEALEKISAQLPDLVVLDIRMEDMTGLEVLEQVRKTYSHEKLPVIMCTAVRGLQDDFTIWDAHVSDYITKPVDLEELKAKIKRILEPATPQENE
ncbi:MAG: response regulator [Candidatus Sumerlaeaceae bacterium]